MRNQRAPVKGERREVSRLQGKNAIRQDIQYAIVRVRELLLNRFELIEQTGEESERNLVH